MRGDSDARRATERITRRIIDHVWTHKLTWYVAFIVTLSLLVQLVTVGLGWNG